MINVVREKVKHFLEEALAIKEVGEDIRITGITNSIDGWIAEAEVVERSRTLPGHRVFERKYYTVKLNTELEIYAYKQRENKETQEEV